MYKGLIICAHWYIEEFGYIAINGKNFLNHFTIVRLYAKIKKLTYALKMLKSMMFSIENGLNSVNILCTGLHKMNELHYSQMPESTFSTLQDGHYKLQMLGVR